jgi:ubiquinone/menaquinone biosynthesis C-methylase UbiE
VFHRLKKWESQVLTDKEELVRTGYDRMAGTYQDTRHLFDNKHELEAFIALLPRDATVVDLGCGAGVPVTKLLVDSGFIVTGVDFSESMLTLATKNVPEAHFIKQNMTDLAFKDNAFNGLTACYSIIHVPREKHATLFHTFHRVLKPNGILLISMGSTGWEGTEDLHGTKMFWSHYDPKKTVQILTDAGFQILWDKHVVDAEETHDWIFEESKRIPPL